MASDVVDDCGRLVSISVSLGYLLPGGRLEVRRAKI